MPSHKRESRRTLSNTTRTCNKLPDVHMCTPEPALMDMDRGTLARIDRRLLAGLGDDEAYRTLRVPAIAAKWSTWKRYCDSVGVSMGRAVTMLIDRELVGVFGDVTGDEEPVFVQRAAEELASREAKIAIREREVDADEQRMRERGERLRRWEDELEARERQAETVSKLTSRESTGRSKIGRNERCPCGSGLKYSTATALPAAEHNAGYGRPVCRPRLFRRSDSASGLEVEYPLVLHESDLRYPASNTGDREALRRCPTWSGAWELHPSGINDHVGAEEFGFYAALDKLPGLHETRRRIIRERTLSVEVEVTSEELDRWRRANLGVIYRESRQAHPVHHMHAHSSIAAIDSYPLDTIASRSRPNRGDSD